MSELGGRVALVTGASSGIGEGLARMLADEGLKVAVAARRSAELDRVTRDIGESGGVAVAIVANLSNEEDIAALLAQAESELGPIDVLVNNAGVAWWKPLEDTTTAE